MPEETESPDTDLSLLGFLGREVKRLRLGAQLTQGEVARKAFATQAMVSYVETGKRIPSDVLAEGFDRVFGTDGIFARLHPLVLRHAYPAWFLPYVELEGAAHCLRVWHGQAIPGLLQTEAYARAVIGATRPTDLEFLVAARMTRQALFEREDRPRTWFVVGEAALRGFRGEVHVMRGQLEHLLRAGEHPRTVIQILPQGGPAHPGLAGAFTVLDLPEGESVIYADAFHRGRMSAEKDELATAEHAYDLLRALALPVEESVGMIRSYAERMP